MLSHIADITSFSWMKIFKYISQLLYPSIQDRHFGYFLILAIVNNASVNMSMQLSLWDTDFNSFSYISRSGIPGWYGRTVFNFLRNCHTFPIITISLHSHQQVFLFSTSLPTIVKSHPNRYEMISHCHFDPSETLMFTYSWV